MMKKFFSGILVIILAFAMISCSNNPAVSSDVTAQSNTTVLQNIPNDGNQEHIETIRKMYADGKSELEIIEFTKKELIASGLNEEELKTLTRLSFTLVEIYCMEDSYRDQFIKDIFKQLDESNQPGGANRILMYEELANQVFLSYKNNSVAYNETFAKPPEDFIFPEIIHWGETKFVQDEMGYYNVGIPSADGKYRMGISINDFTYDGERPFGDDPRINFVAFFEN